MRTVATVAASCPPLLQQALEPAEADELARVLKVLADPAAFASLSLIRPSPRAKLWSPPRRALGSRRGRSATT